MSKRKRQPARSRSRERAEQPPRDLLAPILPACVCLLLVWRMLVPTESAQAGDTLWITEGWLVLAIGWAWLRLRNDPTPFAFDRYDLAVAVFTGGHVVSAIALLAGTGDKRAALNMLWEWLALAISFVLIRRVIVTRDQRRTLVLSLVGVAVVLAALGLWQHYVMYPQLAADFTEFEQFEQTPPSPSDEQAHQRHEELRLQFQIVPREQPARMLFVQRMRESSEPMGLFALANSLAGLLAVWLLIAVALTVTNRPEPGGRLDRLLPVLFAVLLAFCLLLTKSRTAFAGVVGGLTLWGVIRYRSGASLTRRGLILLVASVAGVLLLLGVATLSGGFDRQVVSEASKSLRYRLEYLEGSWELIKDRPWLGTGPGNFRQNYLQYKLPESSEDIGDPHNLFADVWANGGLIPLVGLLAVVTLACVPTREPDDARATSSPTGLTLPILVGCGLGFAVPLTSSFVFNAHLDTRLLLMIPAWIAVATFLNSRFHDTDAPHAALAAATAALVIHLLGAGGIAMPAICQTLLLLIALRHPVVAPSTVEGATASLSHRPTLIWGASMVVLAGTCLMTAAVPVTNCELMMMSAQGSSNPQARERAYLDALTADPLSADPPARLAESAFERWNADPRSPEELFAEGVNRMQIAIEKNPRDAKHHHRLGIWYGRKFRRSGDSQDALAAAEALSRAVQLYPTNPLFHAELAEARNLAGQTVSAGESAARALDLHALNLKLGHLDRCLQQETLQQLAVLAEPHE